MLYLRCDVEYTKRSSRGRGGTYSEHDDWRKTTRGGKAGKPKNQAFVSLGGKLRLWHVMVENKKYNDRYM